MVQNELVFLNHGSETMIQKRTGSEKGGCIKSWFRKSWFRKGLGSEKHFSEKGGAEKSTSLKKAQKTSGSEMPFVLQNDVIINGVRGSLPTDP